VRSLVEELGVNHSDHDGYTSLHECAYKGAPLRVIRYLVELGADVNQATYDGCTPLFLAAKEGTSL
jgi:ankyrin repeat protein